MRITGGKNRGRVLTSPKGMNTRPTADKARQAIFNILEHASWLPYDTLDEALVLDVFAGTGAMGLEALSRGAQHAVFVERDFSAAQVCQENIDMLKYNESSVLLRFDAASPLPRPLYIAPRTLVFMDPPYGKDLGQEALAMLRERNWLAENPLIVMEMSKKNPEPLPEGFTVADERTYGIAMVRFMVRV